MKTKRKWLGVCVVSLSMVVVQVNASGIPVYDGGATLQREKNHALTIAQMVKEAFETAMNWKRNFEEMMRGKFGNLQDSSFKSNDPYTQDEYIELINKMQQKCNKISNEASKKLCIEVYDIDKEKVILFYSSIEDIDKATAALNAAVQNQRTQSGSGQTQTAENEVQIKLDNLKRIIDRYEIELKILNSKQEFKQKARTDIAREQINGTKPNIVNAISQAATAANLQQKADTFRQQAIQLRGYDRDINENKNSNGSKQRADDFLLNRKVLQ